MDYRNAFAISAMGMNIERARVEVAALNLANANTVQTSGGAGYQPLRVIAMAHGPGDGAVEGSKTSGDGGVSFESMVQAGLTASVATGTSVDIVPSDVAPRMVYEPGHPLADERGFVAYAGVDTAAEMVGLMSATRAYEANVAAMNTTRALALKALEIGGRL